MLPPTSPKAARSWLQTQLDSRAGRWAQPVGERRVSTHPQTRSTKEPNHGRSDQGNTARNLIAAEKVEGTDVYNLQGEKLGTVDDIMIDKVSGKAIYAIMSFGGFLGIGEKYHPLPWSTLKYDESKGGYVVGLDRICSKAPTHDQHR